MANQALSANNIFLLNHMNATASKVALGTLLADALSPAGEVALAQNNVLLGDSSGTAQQTPLTTALMTAAPGVYGEATGTLTQANLIAMFTTPVNLLPAPGAGLFYYIEFMELFHKYSTAAYTGGGVVAVQYHGSTVITKSAATLVTATSSESVYQRPTLYDLDNSTGTGKGLDVASLANLGVDITNATAVFAAGNAANVLEWRIRYKLMTLLT
jgi:hypothetical protein